MTSTSAIAHHPLADETSLEALWTTWYTETARFFVPAFIGRSGKSLFMDWSFEGDVLQGQDWSILDDDDERVVNDPDDIERSAHETLAVGKHEDPFFDGLEAIVGKLCGDLPDVVETLHLHLVPEKDAVAVKAVFHTGQKTLSRVIQTAKDIQKIRALLQQDLHA